MSDITNRDCCNTSTREEHAPDCEAAAEYEELQQSQYYVFPPNRIDELPATNDDSERLLYEPIRASGVVQLPDEGITVVPVDLDVRELRYYIVPPDGTEIELGLTDTCVLVTTKRESKNGVGRFLPCIIVEHMMGDVPRYRWRLVALELGHKIPFGALCIGGTKGEDGKIWIVYRLATGG